ncbi:MAG: ketoacyl-ACP synthase III [Spirochaetaceae bacterium]|jgi:3-oxoacyl-[acyl-carrier-protein] synthase-3|nr:ketoacyl-ACP synthase III [Spirochaetaceae bacterium]
MTVEIIGTGRAIPLRRVTNEELAGTIDTSDGWIRSHTGIGSRHIADDGTAASDLGTAAALEALKLAVEQRRVTEKTAAELALTVDLIVVGSTTQDFFGHPATACIVQHKLGAVNAAAMDITQACSSFIYGMETGAALLKTDPRRRRALVIGTEVLSLIVNWEDRRNCVLFGDGAGAVLLEKTGEDSAEAPVSPGPGPAHTGRRGLLRTILGADGSGWEYLMIRRGGSRNPWKKGEIVDTVPAIEMNGHAVYNFAVKVITETIEKMLKEEGIGAADLDLIVPHQANARIVQAAAKRLKIPEEKFYLNIEEYANTSSASIPIALDELNRSGELRRGSLVMTVGFGAGLTYGGNLIRW